MTSSRLQGPFRPGTGGMPPHLAGREAAQALFLRLLGDLANGHPPDREVILHGPRGNGKTVLLRWVETEAARNERLDVSLTTPASIRDRRGLAKELLPKSWWRRFVPSRLSVGGTGIAGRGGDDRTPPVEAALDTRARRRPLVLLLDEAHTLEPALGSELLQASQSVGRRLPFLLVLAGTPNLQSRLVAMNASFWNRAEHLRVGRLSPAAAAEALRKPLAGERIPVSDRALSRLVRESQCYPFFVQLLGQAVWKEAASLPEGRRRVTAALVEAALPSFERVRDEYYAQRFEELWTRRLHRAARAVADAFGACERLDVPALEAAIGRGVGDGASPRERGAALEALRNLGVVWRVEARPDYEPGIPSLMDYLREHAPPA